MLIDTHAHLYWDSYKADFDQVIKRCKEVGVTTIVNVGVDIEKSNEALRLSGSAGSLSEYSLSKVEGIQFYSTIGIHPHEAYKYENSKTLENDINALEEIYHKNPQKVVAVGEVGLDYFFQNNPGFNPNNLADEELKKLQRKLFLSQIDLAKKLNLPLIIHVRDDRSKNPENRECWEECLETVKDSKGILHCYSGTEEITKKAMDLDFLISFAGNITYPKNDYLREAAKILPLEKICLETDSPFLAPQSIRGQRNEPSSVREIAELIAKVKGVSFEEVAEKTTKNVKELFNI